MTEDEIILTHILQCKAIDLIVDKRVLSVEQQQRFDEYRQRRAAGEPLQYILGSWNFMGLELTVNPAVLVPRPETEQMVEYALNYSLPLVGRVREGDRINILDLCTGSGCIAIAIAKAYPNAQVVAIDISNEALDVARANAKRHGVQDRIEFIQADIKLALLARNDRFDLIISNPPYIPTAQLAQLPKDVQQEPALALDGGRDGLDFYREIINRTPRLLREGACLMMEFGDGQAEHIKAMLALHFQVELFKDLVGKERFLLARRY